MKARLLAIFTAAAGLVLGGVALQQALVDANQASGQPLTCKEWKDVVSREAKEQSYFLLVNQGYAPPEAVDGFLLGACSGGACSVAPDGCDAELTYEYNASGLVASHRLAYVRSPNYFARGWKALAASAPEVDFLGGWKELPTTCPAAGLSGSQCRQLAQVLGLDCWRHTNGNLCRRGLLYGPGIGGDQACDPSAAGWRPYPCSSDQGSGWAERVVASDFPTNDELGQ